MKNTVKRITLTGINITGDNPASLKCIPSGVLVVTQEFIDDGLGGYLEGMAEWKIESPYIPVIPISGAQFKMTSGKYSGSCFLLSIEGESMVFQGTGELKISD